MEISTSFSLYWDRKSPFHVWTKGLSQLWLFTISRKLLSMDIFPKNMIFNFSNNITQTFSNVYNWISLLSSWTSLSLYCVFYSK